MMIRCDCGKVRAETEEAARRLHDRLHPGSRNTFYECEYGRWHWTSRRWCRCGQPYYNDGDQDRCDACITAEQWATAAENRAPRPRIVHSERHITAEVRTVRPVPAGLLQTLRSSGRIGA